MKHAIALASVVLVLAFAPSVASAEVVFIDCKAESHGSITSRVIPASGGYVSVTVSSITGCVPAMGVLSPALFVEARQTPADICGTRFTWTLTYWVPAVPASGGDRNIAYTIASHGTSVSCPGKNGVLYVPINSFGENGNILQPSKGPKFRIRTKSAGIGVRG